MTGQAAAPLRRVEHIMGLPISLDLRDPSPPLREAAQQAFDWLREVDRRFSPFKGASEVCRLGRGELGLAQRSPEMAEVLELCARYERDSDGAFRAWLPGRSFDPCGVVKGWAVQRAGQMLRDAGARRFCLNAGGDVLTAGEPDHGRAWRVGIRHPTHAYQLCAVFSVRDAAVATSGTYERGAHIIHGRTGRPVRDLVSLTVIAPDLTTADATSTAAFAMGSDGIAWAAAQPRCLVFAIDAHHRVHTSGELGEINDGHAHEQFQAAREVVEIAAVTALYNIGDRTGADLLAAAEDAGVAFSPWYPTRVPNQGGNAAHFGEVLDPICEKHDATMPQIAIAWLLHRSPSILPIPGTANLTHLEENLRGAAIDLTVEEVNAITQLVPEGAEVTEKHEAGVRAAAWSARVDARPDRGGDR